MNPRPRTRRIQFQIRHLALLVAAIAVAIWWCTTRTGVPIWTGRDLDVAIYGRGYLQVQDSFTGEFGYTRNGRISIDVDGILGIGDSAGRWILQPQITLPQDWKKIQITEHGCVQVEQPGVTEASHIGSLQLAVFMNSDGLRPVIHDILKESDDSGPPMLCSPGEDAAGRLLQGWIEKGPPATIESNTVLLSALVVVALLCYGQLAGIRRALERRAVSSAAGQ